MPFFSIRCRNLLAAGLGALLLVGGCSSSPKDDIVASADETCGALSERFRGDLAFGEGVGADDLDKLRTRAELVRELRDRVRGMPAPEAGQEQLTAWLEKLEGYAKELENFVGQFQQARPGADMLLAMQLNIIDAAARESGTAAAAFGLQECARVDAWISFPK